MKPVVLITGAAGGLGSALVEAFHQQGWRVAAGFHNAPLKVAGEDVLPVALDVTNPDSVTAAVKSVLERWERLDALVNNAGVTVNHLLAQTSDTDWERVSSVTLKGAFLVSQAVLRTMMKQRDGHIVNISSFSARSGPKGQAAYCAAKAGLIGLTQSLAKEAGSRNVRVNAVLPGVLPTPMTADLPGEVMEAFVQANALGRINDVDEVAHFVVFLAGMKNVSGQVFQLDSRVSRWC
jgi:3-oxoacyl-[acyl-carrier protein] reductase